MISDLAIHAWLTRPDPSKVGCLVVAERDAGRTVAALRVCTRLPIVVFDPAGLTRVEAGQAIITSSPEDMRRAVAIELDGGQVPEVMIDPELRVAYSRIIQDALNESIIASAAIEHTTKTEAARWIAHGLAAMPHWLGRPTLGHMPQVFAGRPGIVVGSGPSLAHALPELRRLRGMAVIAACQSALGPLEDAGVQPDIICVVEAQELSIAPVLGSPLWRSAVAMPGVHVHPSIYDIRPAGWLPIIQATGPVGRWLVRSQGLPILTTGQNVASLCYCALRRLGCGDVALVGCDCARGQTGDEVYSAGVRHGSHRRGGPVSPMLPTASYGGRGTVLSTPAQRHFRRWWEEQASTDHRLINCSVVGARILGTEEVYPGQLEAAWDERGRGWRELVSGQEMPSSGQSDIVGALLAAIGSAPVLDRGAVLRSLEAQLEDTERLSSACSIISDSVRTIESEFPTVGQLGTEPMILSHTPPRGVGTKWDLPTLSHLLVLREHCASWAEDGPWLIAKIKELLAREAGEETLADAA